MSDNQFSPASSAAADAPREQAAAAAAPSPDLDQSMRKPDKYIWAIYLALLLVSVVELYSASSREVMASNIFGPILRHGMMLLVGLGLTWSISRMKFKWIIPLTPLFVGLSVLMMIYVLLNGQVINGARRSMSLLGFAIQPSEMIKLSAVLFIAFVMSRNQEKRGIKTQGLAWCALFVLFCGGLLFSQGLTNTILLMAISLSMMLIAGVQLKKFMVVLLIYGLVAAGAVWYKLNKEDADPVATEMTSSGAVSSDQAMAKGQEINRAKEVWIQRIQRHMGDSVPKYLKPIDAKNRQEMYSYMAQANGGLFGVVPGNSRETARLPLAFSDYIFAIVVEDIGFIGAFVLLLLYLSLLARAGSIATRCSRAFPALLVMGMAVMIVFQALFHMAIVTGVFPVSGQPLPLISKGGSSILVTSIAFGIMLSVSRFAVQSNKKHEIKQEISELPAEMGAENLGKLA